MPLVTNATSTTRATIMILIEMIIKIILIIVLTSHYLDL